MATQPDSPQPDRIDPQFPPETPAPAQSPEGDPGEIELPAPDVIEPGTPMETPPPGEDF